MTARLRRRVAGLATAVALVATISACALEDDGAATTDDGDTVVKVGYLHTVAVDTHL